MDEAKEGNDDKEPFGEEVCGLCFEYLARGVNVEQPVKPLGRKGCFSSFQQ